MGGGTNGLAETGDAITFTYTEPIDPESIQTGWTGASTSVTVRIVDGGCTVILCSNDSAEIWNAANTVPLPLGTINLNNVDYNGTGLGLGSLADVTFTATMVRSGAAVTVTLGTKTGGTAHTTGSNATAQWTPSTATYDAAANANTSATKNETGAADKEF